MTRTADIQSSTGDAPVVDLIVPVYRGLEETRRCLDSVLAFPQRTAHEIVVIDDCSPEPELSAWLRELAGSGAITLLVNLVNTGFVNAVNRGMVLHSDRDVVLLNSDTKVNGDWLDRLRRCAYSDPQVGTVTPFSNNATICSYPRFAKDNALPENWPLKSLDKLFAEVNAGQSVEIPTAVGFCMYITRQCLNQVGYFDAVLFRKGYGEENDFSMRAMEVGFRNILAADVFVYHRGKVSFGSESETLCAEAQRVLEQQHPHYYSLIADHYNRDPCRIYRRRVDIARLMHSSCQKILFITHMLGGGTEKHLQGLIELLGSRYEPLILRPQSDKMVTLEWAKCGEEFKAQFPLPYAYTELLEFLGKLQLTNIHFHHVLGFQQQLLKLPKDLNVPYDFTLHDYYSICPQYNLTYKDGRYCGEPDEKGCALCLQERPAPWGMDINSWRSIFNDFLCNANRVFAPSYDVMTRVKKYIPQAPYVYLPHLESIKLVPVKTFLFSNSELKIIILGQLSLAKGLRLVESCAIDAKLRSLPILFKVIGYTKETVKQFPEVPLLFSGPYEDTELPILISRERPDLIFFPALWPETYSYTLSYAIYSGLPIAAPHLGAFIERLSDYPMAWLLDWDTSAENWNDLFVSLLTHQTQLPN